MRKRVISNLVYLLHRQSDFKNGCKGTTNFWNVQVFEHFCGIL